MNFIFHLLYYMPVFSIKIKDKNYESFLYFTKNDTNSIECQKVYISLINFFLGGYNLSLINLIFKREKICNNRFKWSYHDFKTYDFNVISQSADFKLSKEKWENLREDYLQHLDKICKDDIIAERSSLQRRLALEENRISVSRAKMNTYVTFWAFVYPHIYKGHFMCYFKHFDQLSFEQLTEVLILIYLTLNLFMLFCEINRTRTYSFFMFHELKSSENRIMTLNIQYYYDFQRIKRTADMFVTFADMMLYWIIISVLVFIISYSLNHFFL